MNRLLYIPGFLVLTLLYFLTFNVDGYILPYYYTPDGTVIISTETPEQGVRNIIEIAGDSIENVSGLLENKSSIPVVTDQGDVLMMPVSVDFLKILVDFKFPILLSYFFLIGGIWFLHYGNDIHLSVLSFSVTVFLYFTIYILVFHQLEYYWYISYLILSPVLLNMGLRISGKNIGGYLLIGELIYGVFFALVIYAGQNNMRTIVTVIETAEYLLMATFAAVNFLIFSEAIKSQNDPIERKKKWVLFFGVFTGLIIPLVLLKIKISFVLFDDYFAVPSILAFAFPLSLLYGTYRIYLIPFQFVLTRSILAALLTVILISLYSAVLLAHSILLPEQKSSEQWIVNLVFVIILVFFLDPARKNILYILENRLFRLSPEHTRSLEKIASALSSPVIGLSSVNLFLNEITRTLEIEKTIVVLSEGTFEGLELENGQMIRISKKSLFWQHLLPDKIVVASYLTYAGGSRASLYRFLVQNEVYMAAGVIGRAGKRNYLFPEDHAPVYDSRIKAALLLGARKDGRKYTFSEIRYLQEASRLAAMMVNDYSLLINEIEKRRKVRELSAAADVQRSLINPEQEGFPSIHVAHFDIPAISVTGDYLDLVPVSDRKIACFLGDVSGHGLGTGYLVSVIRSIVRSHLEVGASLIETFNLLNHFLHQRYGGHEFLTMFGMILDTVTGDMEYINSAHPAPIIYTSGESTFLRLSDTQRMLGILDKPFTSNSITLKQYQRITLFSDGVTETFNKNDVQFGDSGIVNFIREYGSENLDFITVKLKDVLYEHRGSGAPSDDTSFLVMEYIPREEQKPFIFTNNASYEME